MVRAADKSIVQHVQRLRGSGGQYRLQLSTRIAEQEAVGHYLHRVPAPDVDLPVDDETFSVESGGRGLSCLRLHVPQRADLRVLGCGVNLFGQVIHSDSPSKQLTELM